MVDCSVIYLYIHLVKFYFMYVMMLDSYFCYLLEQCRIIFVWSDMKVFILYFLYF